MRVDGRNFDQIRSINISINHSSYAEGSVLVEAGNTKLICSASVDSTIPKWLTGSGQGWITAEYGMLPRSTHTRMKRENINSSGRSLEISRLIGRSLRAAVSLEKLGERQIIIDCDVIQANGGTRTLAITGGFVALVLALNELNKQGVLKNIPLLQSIAATSVGLVNGKPMLDLCYEEDSEAQTDMNIVMNKNGHFIEIQGTAEDGHFTFCELNEMLELAKKGCFKLFEIQDKIVKDLLY